MYQAALVPNDTDHPLTLAEFTAARRAGSDTALGGDLVMYFMLRKPCAVGEQMTPKSVNISLTTD